MAQLTAHAVVGHVIDGDTFSAQAIPTGWGSGLVNVRVRIDGIDAAERGTPDGDAATAFAKTVVAPGDVVTLTSAGPLGKLDNYGRVLASVTLPDGRDWAKTMVDARQAESYKVAGARVLGVDED